MLTLMELSKKILRMSYSLDLEKSKVTLGGEKAFENIIVEHTSFGMSVFQI